MNKKSKQSKPLVPVFVPPLLTLLQKKERTKGSPLTKEEVLEIRDNATMILMKADEALKMADSRGYRDIDPDKAWEQWLQIRKNR
jgi:hypothetical protein